MMREHEIIEEPVMSPIRTTAAALVVGACVVGAVAADRQRPEKIRILLLSGRNNHNWRATTPALVKMYRRSGRFTVTVTDEPEKLTADAFSRCDVVVSNWTSWPKTQLRLWKPATEKAFLDFIRNGGGLVVFHAASTACQSWPAFQQLVGATWAKGRTGHGRRHEFTVRIVDHDHPVTAGMKDFKTFDELWHRMGRQKDARVLCVAFSDKNSGGTGEDEPVVLCTHMGKGRGFNLVLGHDTRALDNPGWQALMLRGTEWAATGKVTLPPLPAGDASPAAPAAPAAATGKRALAWKRTDDGLALLN
ncbi:MAG: ThuA domain-containing protein, partial [Planctomycetes bacterium]|nr:ThuA domain-containing protein [Planctomycetota bacterium]